MALCDDRTVAKHEALLESHSVQLAELKEMNKHLATLGERAERTAHAAAETANGIKTELVILNEKLFRETLDSESIMSVVKKTRTELRNHLDNHQTIKKGIDKWTITLGGALASTVAAWLYEILRKNP